MKFFKNFLINWWTSFVMSEHDRYLSQAKDHADLERRLRSLSNRSNFKTNGVNYYG